MLIFTESFETDGNGTRYTTSIPEFSDGMGDFFTRTDGGNIGGAYQVTNGEGSFFFAAQDIDGEGAASQQILSFSGIDISGFTNLNFSALFAEDDDGNNQDWDDTEFVRVEYQIDGGGFENLFAIAELDDGDRFNQEPGVDGDFDGVADGSAITSTFTEFSSAIAGTGTSLDLRFTIDLNAGDEDIAIDNIQIAGDSLAADIALSSPAIAAASVLQGTTDRILYQLDLAVTTADAELVEATFTTGGTYIPADLASDSFELFYSIDAIFDAGDTSLGTQAVVESGNNLTFTGLSQTISRDTTGTLFLVTDLAAVATADNTINIAAPDLGDFTFASGNQTGTLLAGFGEADRLDGNDDNDLIFGNSGNDTIDGGTGDDLIFAGQDDDLVTGGKGIDVIAADIGNDTVDGNGGNDVLFGNTGADVLDGDDGDDVLFGGRDNDIVLGGAGNDLVSGDLGDDLLVGGAGGDRFDFRPGDGIDVVADFTDGIDIIGLKEGLTFADLTLTQVANDTQIAATGLTITLQGVNVGVLNAADFAGV